MEVILRCSAAKQSKCRRQYCVHFSEHSPMIALEDEENPILCTAPVYCPDHKEVCSCTLITEN